MLFTIFIITLLFLLYIQYSPGMGNIWYRNNEYFSPMGALYVMVFPFQNVQMWYPTMWDINYIMWLLIGVFVHSIFDFIGKRF
jgi:hypothetical protein